VLGRVITTAGIGNFVEWFDYSIYGFLAAIIGGVFFASEDPTTALLASFAILAVPVFVRPLGGLFWSHFGDRIGRQRTLAIVIIVMSLATMAIGLLPGYATIGVLAPILLVTARAIQGFSAGGEYAGGACFMAEYSPDSRRGYLTGWMAVTTGSGVLVGSLLAFLLTSSLSEEAMNSWGWRIPFLIAGPIGIIGLYLRLTLEDTPMFRALKAEHEVAQAPLKESFAGYWRQILLAACLTLGQVVTYYAILIYTPTYLTTQLGFGRSEALLASTLTVAFYVALIPPFAALSDRVGRKPLMLAGCGALLLLAYPGFLLISQGGLLTVIIVQVLLGGVLLPIYTSPIVATLVELFPTRVRYSGFANGFNASAVVANAAPFFATFLIARTGSDFVPAWFVIVTCLVSIIAIALLTESANKPLPQVQGSVASR
jgi:MHS family proline/betaine transporter-like MFS transporter